MGNQSFGYNICVGGEVFFEREYYVYVQVSLVF